MVREELEVGTAGSGETQESIGSTEQSRAAEESGGGSVSRPGYGRVGSSGLSDHRGVLPQVHICVDA